MSKQRKQYSAAVKSKVALEAIKGVRSMNEIATHYGVHPNQPTPLNSPEFWGIPTVSCGALYLEPSTLCDGQ